MDIPDIMIYLSTIRQGVSKVKDSFLVSVDNDLLNTVSLPKILLKNFRKIGLTPDEMFLYLIIKYLKSEGEPIPSQPELAEMMGVSERKLKYIIASLKDKNLLFVNKRKGVMHYNFEPIVWKLKELELAQ